jgi:hypothetical protein
LQLMLRQLSLTRQQHSWGGKSKRRGWVSMSGS